jgi:hypothetical protein
METRRYFTLRIPLPSNVGWLRRLLPTPGNVLFTLLVVGALLWAASAGALPLRAPAAAGTSTGTIAYQGRLADANGNPLTGTYNMIFRLYDAAGGGTPLWTEQWTGSNGVRVSDGLFNVMLGSLTPIPQSVITGHDSLFLGITVGTDDEMTPRVQLGSVPFAVQALTVPDGSVTTAKIADGAVTQVVQLSTSGTLVTNAKTFSTIPGLETTFGLDSPEVVEIQFNAGDTWNETNGGGGDFRIMVDGNWTGALAAFGWAEYPAGLRSPVTLSWVQALSPGSHTVAAQWEVPPWAPDSTLYIGGTGKARLIVTRFKR